MTYAELYKECRKKLTHDTADFDLSQLFKAYFHEYNRLIKPEAEVEADEAFIFQMKIKRLIDGYPLQYLLGEWEFYGLPVKVGEGVLIPRPDTETVVDAALELGASLENPIIADLCAGSGAISLAIAANMPNATLYAVELSEEAIAYLAENIVLNNLSKQIIVQKADVLADLALPPLDMIVSNPPYIRKADLQLLSVQVSHEPVMALDGGDDGLDFYRAIAKNAQKLLKPSGLLLFEAGYDQADSIATILSQLGYQDISFKSDLNKIRRCVYATNLDATLEML